MGVTNYKTVNGQLRGEKRSGKSHSRDYVSDGLGNIVGVYQNGWLCADGCYSPYGGLYSGWAIDSDGYKFTWLGAWGYRQTGRTWPKVYVRARHYAPLSGSWTTVDPLWPSEPAYGYVGGRAMDAVDPSGTIVYTSKNCGQKSKAAILSAVRELNRQFQSNSEMLENFISCLLGLVYNCNVLAMHSRNRPDVMEPIFLNNNLSDVNFTIECTNCNSARCGWTDVDAKTIHICVPYKEESCGPLKCTILHEMIHLYTHILDFPKYGDPTSNPWSCLDDVSGCEGQR